MQRLSSSIGIVLGLTLCLAAGTAAAGDTEDLAKADFNGDRFADLAIGVPDEAVGTIAGAISRSRGPICP